MIIKIKNKGFTLVELMVSVGIFVMMTGLLLSKYGTFNQGILLTNLAYDVALTIRNAQSYGLNVKSSPTESVRFSNNFDNSYGVHFVNNTASFIFFADTVSYGQYTSSDVIVSNTSIQRGSKISALCAGSSSTSCNTASTLDITFKRPDPNAIINSGGSTFSYAEITLQATDGSLKKVIVRSTGQIAVQ